MNKDWSELNKTMQLLLKKEESLHDGIKTLVDLRNQLMDVLLSFKKDLKRADFDAIPFMNDSGYHCKTIGYSIWHIFRIEDIVAHTLIAGDDQIFFTGNYQRRIHSPIITTGNELVKQQIADFSRQLDLDELYAYITDVKRSTETIVNHLPYDRLRWKVPEERKERLKSLQVVSTDERASWLIDYWCGKDIRGLIQMPFSRHWIMHIEACLKIKNKLYP